jgi:hypothetical protein
MSRLVDALQNDMEQARAEFAALVAHAAVQELRRRSNGTRWSNRQLLFHMVFGYLIVLRLLPLVRFFGRLPDRYSRRFAAVLDAATAPFHVINYLGSVGGGQVLTPTLMVRLLDRTVAALHRHLEAETDADLARRMHFPTRWDPYFRETMTLADVYSFGTQHFQHHRRQLTLDPSDR